VDHHILQNGECLEQLSD